MKKNFLAMAAVGLMAGPIVGNATPFSSGDLSSNDDGSTEIITDSLNSYEWLRWDVVDQLTMRRRWLLSQAAVHTRDGRSLTTLRRRCLPMLCLGRTMDARLPALKPAAIHCPITFLVCSAPLSHSLQ